MLELKSSKSVLQYGEMKTILLSRLQQTGHTGIEGAFMLQVRYPGGDCSSDIWL